MNGLFLILPFFIIRFGMLAYLGKTPFQKAAVFAPLQGMEIPAYWIHQTFSQALIFSPILLSVNAGGTRLLCGMVAYTAGITLLALSAYAFAKPDHDGLITSGIYRFSRNPMYLSYYFVFFGVACLTGSILYLVSLVAFVVSTHIIILSEERWCSQAFKGRFLAYKAKVRRYF